MVVAWHPDRLHRSPAELEDFIALLEQTSTSVATAQAGHWDLSTPSGRLVARQLGGVARYESEHKSERVKRALQQNAAVGRSHGRAAYGWSRDASGETVNPLEAAVVVEMTDRIIRGDSLRGIVADLNRRAIPSPTGKPWAKNMVRAVVLRERNIGHRVHRGTVVGPGAWEPIISEDQWSQVQAVLRDPSRRRATSSAAVHLLSGIAVCGVCGAAIRGSLNRQVPSYRCSEKACVSRRRADVDALVSALVRHRLASLDVAAFVNPEVVNERNQAQQEAAVVRARLDGAADDFADGKIDARQLERISARLLPRLKELEERSNRVDDAGVLRGVTGQAMSEEAWEQLSLSRRRALVDLLLRVAIDKARSGSREFDPRSVRIEWRS